MATEVAKYETDIFRNYLKTEAIGKGSFGEVYKAIHRKTRQCVALKKVLNASVNLMNHLREVKMMKKCKEGKNIIQIYGSEIVENDLWISMELCDCGSTFDIMRLLHAPFSEAQVAYICRSALRAIKWMSERNIAHRDIKPHNLFLSNSGKIRLGDLGICREMDANGLAKDMIGSLLYLAPEVARQRPYTCKVDIWSLGITAIELAQGIAPRHALNSDELLKVLVHGKEPPFLAQPNQFSDSFKDFVRSCLVIEPSDRPTADQLLDHPFIGLAEKECLVPVAKDVAALVSLNGSFASALEGALMANSARSSVVSALSEYTCHTDQSSYTSSEGKMDAESNTFGSPMGSPVVSPGNTPTPGRIVITPGTPRRVVPPFARPLLRMPSKLGMNEVFTVGVAPSLVSPREVGGLTRN